jgi:CubicO group peptidase (beta-lactamase class C family)
MIAAIHLICESWSAEKPPAGNAVVRMLNRLWLVLLLGIGLSTSCYAQAGVENRELKTVGGASVIISIGWDVATDGTAQRLTLPEDAGEIMVSDIGRARDAHHAALQAMSRSKHAGTGSLKVRAFLPPTRGWSEIAEFGVGAAPADKRELKILVFRAGDRWTALSLNVDRAAAEKRAAEIRLVVDSLTANGFVPEDFSTRRPNAMSADRVALLQDFVNASMRQLDVPGASIAVVERDRVIWQGGFGHRGAGLTDRVDAHTQFMIASNTKGLTTLLLAALVDDGKLRWDQPVAELLPEFALGDPAATQATQVRHLVCACTGMPRKDMEWFATNRDTPASDTFRQLAQTTPTTAFGTQFQYNNLMAAAAGYLAGRLSYPDLEFGRAFDRAIQVRILDPLEMADTSFELAMPAHGNRAAPHGMGIDGQLVGLNQSYNGGIYPFRPSGGAWSSAADFARYVQLELNRGKTSSGVRIVSEANVMERRRRSVSMGNRAWYGMGLMEDRTWGVEVIHHGGGLAGFRSDWFALPDAGIGVVLLTNSSNGVHMLQPFARRLLELLYDGRAEATGMVASAAANAKLEMATLKATITDPPHASLLPTLAERYFNEALGPITIRRSSGSTRLQIGVVESAFGSRRNVDGSYSLVLTDPDMLGLEFSVTGTALVLRDAQHEYRFEAAGGSPSSLPMALPGSDQPRR